MIKLKKDANFELRVDERGDVSLMYKQYADSRTVECCVGTAEWNEHEWEVMVSDYSSVRLAWTAKDQQEAIDKLWAERSNLNFGYLN